MLLRVLCRVLMFILGVCLLAGGLAWYAVGTQHGSRLVTSRILARAVKARRLSVAYIGGTLWDGLALRAIEIEGLKGLPEGSRLRLQGVDTSSLSTFIQGTPPKFVVHFARLETPPLMDIPRLIVSVNTAEGGLTGDWTLNGIAVEGIPLLSPGPPVTAQQITVSLPVSLRHIRALRNGKIPLQYSEPVIVSGSQIGGQLDMSVYSKTVDAQEALELIGVRRLRDVEGTVTDANLHVTGTIQHPAVSGGFRIAKLLRRGFAMADCPGALSLRLRSARYERRAHKAVVEVEGKLDVWLGSLATKNTMIRLEPSHLTFAGELDKPSYDVSGVALVQGVIIRMRLKGTKDRPELRLSSEPPKPQEQLLLMLATGKGWQGTDVLLTGNQIPVDLVNDFVDFAFFGGRGTRLAHRFGISDISLTYDPQERGVGVGTVLFNRVEAGYEVKQSSPEEPTSNTNGAVPTTHKIGAGYKLSTDSSITIEGEKTVEPRTAVKDTTSAEPPAKLNEDVFDKVLLKYKRKF